MPLAVRVHDSRKPTDDDLVLSDGPDRADSARHSHGNGAVTPTLIGLDDRDPVELWFEDMETFPQCQTEEMDDDVLIGNAGGGYPRDIQLSGDKAIWVPDKAGSHPESHARSPGAIDPDSPLELDDEAFDEREPRARSQSTFNVCHALCLLLIIDDTFCHARTQVFW